MTTIDHNGRRVLATEYGNVATFRSRSAADKARRAWDKKGTGTVAYLVPLAAAFAVGVAESKAEAAVFQEAAVAAQRERDRAVSEAVQERVRNGTAGLTK